MPDQTLITMMTLMPLGTASGLARLLDAFEHQPTTMPTHWGMDERARNPYDRAAMIAGVTEEANNILVPGLHRRKPPRYQAYFAAYDSGLNYVKIDFGSSLKPADLARVFVLGDTLAEQLTVEFGLVHLIWRLGEQSQNYSAAGVIKARDLQQYGLKAPCARTWFGPHLVRLLGRDRLAATGAPQHDTAWGAVQFDLTEQPWTADFATLSARQNEVMTRLQPSGIFGDYSNMIRYQPGPRWEPIPVPATGAAT